MAFIAPFSTKKKKYSHENLFLPNPLVSLKISCSKDVSLELLKFLSVS